MRMRTRRYQALHLRSTLHHTPRLGTHGRGSLRPTPRSEALAVMQGAAKFERVHVRVDYGASSRKSTGRVGTGDRVDPVAEGAFSKKGH